MLNPQTLYLTLFVGFGLPEEYNRKYQYIAAFNAASGEAGLFFLQQYGALAFHCEMYASRTQTFHSSSPRDASGSMSSSAKKFQEEEYEKAARVCTVIPSSWSLCCGASNNEYIYPKIVSNTSDSRLYIEGNT